MRARRKSTWKVVPRVAWTALPSGPTTHQRVPPVSSGPAIHGPLSRRILEDLGRLLRVGRQHFPRRDDLAFVVTGSATGGMRLRSSQARGSRSEAFQVTMMLGLFRLRKRFSLNW